MDNILYLKLSFSYLSHLKEVVFQFSSRFEEVLDSLNMLLKTVSYSWTISFVKRKALNGRPKIANFFFCWV